VVIMWTLYRQKLHERVYHYAWVSPDGMVKFNRVIAPVGWVWGMWRLDGDFKAIRKISPGWHKVNTKMTQEQLSKGYLT